MVQKNKELHPPKGLARLGFRLPIYLYRIGMGGLLGTRFLMLTHIGRKSGQERQTVLEVVRFDKVNNSFIVAVGFGTQSDWYQNIKANPKVTVQCGRQKWDMTAHFLDAEQGSLEMVYYAHRHPLAMKKLAQFMGYKLDGTEEDIRTMGKMISFVSFQRVRSE
jgi:deazaflavin-dependent oxidoreductase (nitroreductase family)